MLATSFSSGMRSEDAVSGYGHFDVEESIELLSELSASDMGAVLPVAVEDLSMMESELGGRRVAFLVLACEALGSA